MPNSNLTEPLQRNTEFADTYAQDSVPAIPFIPNRQLYLITCIDPRVDPANTLALALGDAIVARNVGGRVTPSLIKDLAWIVHLHENKTPDADWFEIAVIHHTDCGSGLLADDDLRAGYVARGGWDDATARALAVLEPHQTVREDVEKIRTAPELTPGIEHVVVGGYVYAVTTGRITTVVEPGR